MASTAAPTGDGKRAPRRRRASAAERLIREMDSSFGRSWADPMTPHRARHATQTIHETMRHFEEAEARYRRRRPRLAAVAEEEEEDATPAVDAIILPGPPM